MNARRGYHIAAPSPVHHRVSSARGRSVNAGGLHAKKSTPAKLKNIPLVIIHLYSLQNLFREYLPIAC